MKVLLSLLGSVGIIAASSSTSIIMNKIETKSAETNSILKQLTDKTIISPLNIEVGKTFLQVHKGFGTGTTINNYKELSNIKVESSNEKAVSAGYDGYGGIVVIGVEYGGASVRVTADNERMVIITVSVI